MTGFVRRKRVGPSGPSPSSVNGLPLPLASAFRSAPAQKVPAAPVSTATAWCSPRSKARNVAASAAAVGPSIAFRTAGRLMVTTRTSPSDSTSIVLMRCPLARDLADDKASAQAERMASAVFFSLTERTFRWSSFPMSGRALRRFALTLGLLLAMCHSVRAGTIAVLDSDPGDPLGGGVEHVFASVEDAHLQPLDDVLVVTITSAPADGWSFAFRPPAGGRLVPGIYEGAGALDVTTTPSRCETTTGRFQLIDLVASEPSPRSFAVDFEVRCTNATGLLHGPIRH